MKRKGKRKENKRKQGKREDLNGQEKKEGKKKMC